MEIEQRSIAHKTTQKMNVFLALIVGVTFGCCGFTTGNQTAQGNTFEGPIPKPASGYGSNGSYSVKSESFQNPAYTNGHKPEIFFADDKSGPQPVVFFAHGFGGTNSAYYRGIIEWMVRKGYAVVFIPYPTQGESIQARYDILWAGFKEAARRFSQTIDTTKVGFAGHSFGGGASFALAYKGFAEEGWGDKGRFIFSLAPWYPYNITTEQLANFPKNTKLLMEVYADDETNDHRIAIDIYNSINIDDSEKDFICVQSGDIAGYHYSADHGLPVTYQPRKRPLNAYDYYAVYRLLDALIDYAFNGSVAGKNTALGNGSALQVTMPSINNETLKPLLVTDHPQPVHEPGFYRFSCANKLNPRPAQCK